MGTSGDSWAGLSIFARHGATDFRPRWATRRDGAWETLAEKVADGNRQTAGPKRNLSPFGHVVDSYVVSTRYEGHGAKYRSFDKLRTGLRSRKMDTPVCRQAGGMGKPAVALSEPALNEVKGLWRR